MIEGPTLIADAISAGVRISDIFATRDTDPSLIDGAAAGGSKVWSITDDVLARAVDTVSPQGVAAIAPRLEIDVDSAVAAAAGGPLALVLVDVGDPGNAGTLLRAAEAAGASAVLFCGGSVDPCNPKCVRASAGALFHVPVAIGGGAVVVLDLLRAAGVPTFATAVDGGVPHDDADMRGPLALVVGNEAHGLPAELLAMVDHTVTIPMVGRSESLNVAMAGTVLCFESLRQRRLEGHR